MKYDKSWIDSASLEELESEREKIRQEKMDIYSPNSSISDSEQRSLKNEFLQKLLDFFDNAIRKFHDKNDDSSGTPRHREHGWYLPNDDD